VHELVACFNADVAARIEDDRGLHLLGKTNDVQRRSRFESITCRWDALSLQLADDELAGVATTMPNSAHDPGER